MSRLEAVFPRLTFSNFAITSDASARYNCIAWAAGDTSRWWWPDRMGQQYWPSDAPREATLAAFIRAFESLGFQVCADGSPTSGFDKIVIYAQAGSPTHAAKLLPDGRWSSKLGKSNDIEHDLDALEGEAYGKVVAFLRRERPPGF